MRVRAGVLVLGALLYCATTARAQVAWDTPLLVSPRGEAGVGLFLTDHDPGGVGFMVTWRRMPQSLGLRAGIADGPGDDVSLYLGVDVSGTIARANASFPLDIAWVAGGGAGFGDFTLLRVPLGISVGHTFASPGIRFTPYLSPRIVFDGAFGLDRGPGQDDSETDLDFAADLGLDFQFQPSWLIRFGATFGDREALAIGIVF